MNRLPLTDDPLLEARPAIARYVFGSAAIGLLLGGLLMLLHQQGSATIRGAILGTCVVLSALCVAGMRQRGRALEFAVVGMAASTIALLTACGVLLGWGINSALLGFFGLIPCVVALTSARRVSVALATLSAAAACALALAEQQGWLLGAPAVTQVPLLRRLGDVLLLIGAGLSMGLLVNRVVNHYTRSSIEREQRFGGLLAIAADAYWEMDARFRIVYVAERGPDGQFIPGTPTNLPPWENPLAEFDEELLDAHRADLEQWRPFRDMPARYTGPKGEALHRRVSGNPRFDARGVFLGYWGVTRDVTVDVAARESLAATEGRYRELFTRIPTALLLHRDGVILEANPAAVALFGYPDEATLLGKNLVDFYESEGQRQQAAIRAEAVRRLPVGHGLPMAEFHMRARNGRRLAVRASIVRVPAPSGPVMLSIYSDETERRAAEDAVHRSEALLSHVVATSPDVITLSELETGRYAMVNETFLRLSGYSMDEVIGRTAAELGLWSEPVDRDALMTALTAGRTLRDMPAEFRSKDGRVILLLISAARFQMDGRDYLVTNGRDVTASEMARLEREAILENASIGIALTRNRSFQLANPHFEAMFGWGPGELAGQPGSSVWLDDETYRQFGEAVGPALGRGEPIELERQMRRRDGSHFMCRLQARAVDTSHPSRGGTIWIAEDVTERRAVDEALARARDEAEAASEAKSAFLANTSHEIRTPLNGLLGLARLARQPDIGEGLRLQYLEQISESAETLTTIISDILDLSKVEAGKLHLETVSFDLHGLLRTLERGYRTLADARGLSLSLHMDDHRLQRRVRGDPMRVRQILSNFLTNALKFTSRGSVRLTASAVDGSRVRFEVQDTGPGIAAETQQRLFQPFTQADQSTTRRFGGTGLGLSICRELAVLMGGQVGLESAPGVGSCFWAEVPLPEAEDDGPTSAFATFDDDSPLSGKRVLMVEDNPVNMMIAVALLEQWGVKVEQAHNGAQAVAIVTRATRDGQPLDAVLMDVQMPVMSGHEAARLLRRHHSAEQLPIIALTAAALVSERDQALAAGMNDFLTKPIDAQRLHDTLVRVMRPA